MRSKFVKIESAGTSNVYNIDGSAGATTASIIAMDHADIDDPSAVGIPAWAKSADIVAENIDFRYRADGVDPTSSVGHPIYKEVWHTIKSRITADDFTKYKFVQMSGSSAVLNVTFTDAPSDKFGSAVFIY
jgi:hypothetical protein